MTTALPGRDVRHDPDGVARRARPARGPGPAGETAVIDSGYDIEVAVTAENARQAANLPKPAFEPCESCGTPVTLHSIAALLEILYGRGLPSRLGEIVNRPAWQEAHSGPEALTFTYRRHTPERCRLVRAGTPEPLHTDDLDDDEEDL